MTDSGTMEAGTGRKRVERIAEGLVVALVSALALGLLYWPVLVFGGIGVDQVAHGGGFLGRLAAPVLCFGLIVMPPLPAAAVFRRRRRRGAPRLTAALPAALTLLAAAVVPFAALWAVLWYALSH
ncbi:hypothetical protein [Streptomyces sp. NPDC060194]|uniref:hypothetical protein n=1 Tax=Streptomyces sp. NPDC060194 TaxID=3347069 RepID=UPI0036692FA1